MPRYPLLGLPEFGTIAALANLKVVGSNPTPATTFTVSGPETWVTERT